MLKFSTQSMKHDASFKNGPKKGCKIYPDDRAAGVGIILSQRAKKKLLTFGTHGERICWVRIKGPICNLFIIAIYLPHRGRVQPSQEDTLKDLEYVLSNKVPQGDCVCVLGDLNEQLEADVKGRTGKYTAGPKSPNADAIMQLMQLHELSAANTLFKPRRRSALQTFLQTKRSDTIAHNDLGEYVGKKTVAKFKGRWIRGEVKSTSTDNDDEQQWLVKFDDGYIKIYDRKALEAILVREPSEKVGRQLDYILISTRWKSCVQQCRTRWGPAIYRDLHGEKNDHALLECTWTWRIRMQKKEKCKDLDCLYEDPTDEEGKPIENVIRTEFQESVAASLTQQGYDAVNDDTTTMYEKTVNAINHAIETVIPTKEKTSGIRREVSEHTESLYKKRTQLCGQGTAEQYREIQREIKASALHR